MSDDSMSDPDIQMKEPSLDVPPTGRRRVRFTDGFIAGKSDVKTITKVREAENRPKVKGPSVPLEPINFHNYKDWTTASASDTSEDEMDFERTTDKYRTWSHQHQANERKKQMRQELKRKREEIEKQIEEVTLSIPEARRKRLLAPLNERSFAKWREEQRKRGVIYISTLPFGTTGEQLRKIFNDFGKTTHVYLQAAKPKTDESTNQNAGRKRAFSSRQQWKEYSEGWVEFEDKSVAKMAARVLNGTKIPKKYVHNRRARQHVWSIKYLKGFKWRHLQEHRENVRQMQRKKYGEALKTARKQAMFFRQAVRDATHASSAYDQVPDQVSEKESKKQMNLYLNRVQDRDVDSFLDQQDGWDSDSDEMEDDESSDDSDVPEAKKRRIVKQKEPRRGQVNPRLREFARKLF